MFFYRLLINVLANFEIQGVEYKLSSLTLCMTMFVFITALVHFYCLLLT